jgi:His-Xaa-Ser system protein HxsD
MDNHIKIENDFVVLKINPKVYPIETVYSAAYVFLDKAYVVLDGDPKKEIVIKLKPKEKYDLKKLGNEFFNELINYADYHKRAKDTKELRQMILQRAIITNDPSVVEQEDDKEFEKLLKELDEDDETFDDPEGIAIPWEEKYGKKAKKTKGKKKNAKPKNKAKSKR